MTKSLPLLSLFSRGAFTPESAYGGFLGVLVVGIQRAAFSNEAGLGSAAIAHSVARVNHPVEEGTVALLEPFIDDGRRLYHDSLSDCHYRSL